MNNKYRFSEKELCLAAEESCILMLSGIPDIDSPVSFTDGFLDRMDKLIQKIRKRRHSRKALMQFIAVFIAAMLVVFTWLTIDVQAREKLFNWLKTYGSRVIHYEFTGETGDPSYPGDVPEFELTWLPEGYNLTAEDDLGDIRLFMYENGKDGLIITCELAGGSLSSGIFGEKELKHDSLTINGMEAEMVYGSDPSDSNNLTWFDADNGIIFSINSTLAPDIMIRIAEGVRLVE